jgi:hypothetical protein
MHIGSGIQKLTLGGYKHIKKNQEIMLKLLKSVIKFCIYLSAVRRSEASITIPAVLYKIVNDGSQLFFK